MRPVRVYLNAAGYSQWVLLSYLESWFGATASVVLSSGANLTYSVQYAMDFDQVDPQNPIGRVSISRSGTTATVTDPGPYALGHGLSTGDCVFVAGSGSAVLDSPTVPAFGTGPLGWTVTATGANTYTYTVANSGPTSDTGNAYVSRFRVFTHAVLASQTVRNTGTFNYPIRACRLYISSYTSGYADMTILQGINP